jgi:hypothetical protein
VYVYTYVVHVSLGLLKKLIKISLSDDIEGIKNSDKVVGGSVKDSDVGSDSSVKSVIEGMYVHRVYLSILVYIEYLYL